MKTFSLLTLLIAGVISLIATVSLSPLPSSLGELNFPKRTPIYRIGVAESEESEEEVFKEAQDEQDNASVSDEDEQSFDDRGSSLSKRPSPSEFESAEHSITPWHRTEDDDLQLKSDRNPAFQRIDENEIHDDDEDEEEAEDDDKDDDAQEAIQATSSFPISPWEESSYGVRRRSGLESMSHHIPAERDSGLGLPIFLRQFYKPFIHWQH